MENYMQTFCVCVFSILLYTTWEAAGLDDPSSTISVQDDQQIEKTLEISEDVNSEQQKRVDLVQTDDKVEKALQYVEDMKPGTCNNGTGDVLQLDFDVTVWNQYTDPAIRTANFLSKIIQIDGGTLDNLSDEMFFLMVRNNVHGDSLIFGSAIALEPGIYSKYSAFCPYAYKKNNTVRSHDLSLNYSYLDPKTEWYNSVKIKQWENVTIVTDGISYRKNTTQLPETHEVYPIAELPDGHWTKPYYDCGGGNIWMVTYSSPIFKIIDGAAVFQGVATIDIEMSSIDINQCDASDTEEGSGLDVFQGTHRCQPTTKCVPVRGMGFVVGMYHCVCEDGFYFPDLNADLKAYRGEVIDAKYRIDGAIGPDMYRCTACAAGCDTCVDDSPCLFYKSPAIVIIFTILVALTAVGFLIIAIATYLYKHETAIKSASPIFLEIMCLGGILICFEFFTENADPSVGVCSLRIWLLHLGFFILYGSLIFKTWRISVIFTVGTQKRVRLPDQVLLQRFGLLVLLAVGILTAWNASQIPSVNTLKAGNGLKFYVCVFGPWEYAVFGVETVFLLYGVYLCFTVRRAPAHFNESKHITWAVYNAIILGSVVTLMVRLVTSVIGPNLILILHFAQIQVYSTMTILFIFVPKFHAIYKKIEVGPTSDGTLNTVTTITGRIKRHQVTPASIPTQTMNASTQTG